LLPLFTRPTWARAQALLCGVPAGAPGACTVTAALRALGLGEQPRFEAYHRLLEPGTLVGAGSASRVLLALLVEAFAPAGEPLVRPRLGGDGGAPRGGKRIAARALSPGRRSFKC
jgi:hypothetical protein